MRDGILKVELDSAVSDLKRGAGWDVAARHLAAVDPKVVAVNKTSILKLAGIVEPPPPPPVKEPPPAAKKALKHDPLA